MISELLQLHNGVSDDLLGLPGRLTESHKNENSEELAPHREYCRKCSEV